MTCLDQAENCEKSEQELCPGQEGEEAALLALLALAHHHQQEEEEGQQQAQEEHGTGGRQHRHECRRGLGRGETAR